VLLGNFRILSVIEAKKATTPETNPTYLQMTNIEKMLRECPISTLLFRMISLTRIVVAIKIPPDKTVFLYFSEFANGILIGCYCRSDSALAR
jgi:hypothetical protein